MEALEDQDLVDLVEDQDLVEALAYQDSVDLVEDQDLVVFQGLLEHQDTVDSPGFQGGVETTLDPVVLVDIAVCPVGQAIILARLDIVDLVAAVVLHYGL